MVSVLATLVVATLPRRRGSICAIGGGAGLCTYWGQSYNGDQVEIVNDRSDLAASPVVYYPANGTGEGEHVYNNNGSEHNGNGSCSVTIYYNPGYWSYSVTMAPTASRVRRRPAASSGTCSTTSARCATTVDGQVRGDPGRRTGCPVAADGCQHASGRQRRSDPAIA